MAGYDDAKMKATMDVYMRNEYWKEVYENAPSDQCREYFRLGFYSSLNPRPDDADAAMNAVYDRLTIKDWQYLRKIHTGTPFVKTCHDRIQALMNMGQSPKKQNGE